MTVLRANLTATTTLLAISVLLQTSLRCVEGRIVCVPEVQKLPTLDKPFIFIHQRKSGGTSLRRAIVKAAVELKINNTIFVPCFQKVLQTCVPPSAASAYLLRETWLVCVFLHRGLMFAGAL